MRKSLIILTPIVTLATVILHTLQLLNGIDTNGFPIKGYFASIPLIVLVVISVLFSFVVMFVTKNKKQSEKIIPKYCGIIFFIAAVFFGIDGFKYILDFFKSNDSINVFLFVLAIFELISALILVVFSCRILMVFNFKFEKSLFLAMIPLIWLLIRLAYEFLSYTTVANISSYYYHVLMTASVLMFLLYFFKSIASNFYLSESSVIGFSLPVVMFSFTAIIPSIIKAIIDGNNILTSVSFFDFSCLIISIFAYLVTIELTFNRKNINI